MTLLATDKITKVMDTFLNAKCFPVILISKTVRDLKDFLNDGVFIELEKDELEKQIHQLDDKYKKKLSELANAVPSLNDTIKKIKNNSNKKEVKK